MKDGVWFLLFYFVCKVIFVILINYSKGVRWRDDFSMTTKYDDSQELQMKILGNYNRFPEMIDWYGLSYYDVLNGCIGGSLKLVNYFRISNDHVKK